MPGTRPGRTHLFAFGLILLAAVASAQTTYDIWAQDGPYTRLTDLKATAPGATTPTLTLGGVRVPTTGNFKAGTGVTVSTSGGDVTYSSTASTGDYLTSASVTATSPITATPGAGTVAVGFDTTWPPVQGYITTGTLTGGWPVSVAVGGNNEALIGLDPAFSTIISDTLTPSGLHSEDPIEIETDTAEATFTLSDAANTSIGLAHAQNTDTGSSAATFTVNDLAADNATVTGQVNAFYLGATNGIQTSGTASATTVAATTVNAANVTATNQVNAYYLGSTNSIQTSGPLDAFDVNVTNQVNAFYLGATNDIQASGSVEVLGAVNGYGASNSGTYAHEFTGTVGVMGSPGRINSPAELEITAPIFGLVGEGALALLSPAIGYGAYNTLVEHIHEFFGSVGMDWNLDVANQVNAFYVGTTNSIQTSGTLDATTVNAPTVAATNVTATNNVSATNNVTAAYLGSSGDVQATGTVTAGTLSAPTISGTNASVANLTATEQVKAMYLGSSGDVQATGTVTGGALTGDTITGTNVNTVAVTATGQVKAAYLGSSGALQTTGVAQIGGALTCSGITSYADIIADNVDIYGRNLYLYGASIMSSDAGYIGYGASCTNTFGHEFTGSIGLMDATHFVFGTTINVVPSASITFGDGGSTNYTAINATGHLTMAGAATVWDDVTIPGFDVRVAGVSDPAWAKFKDNGTSSTGVYLWWFDPGTLQQVYFTIQMPHDWKQGSLIKPHVHWTPEVTADGAPANQTVEWGCEITTGTIGGAFGNTQLIYAKTHKPADANVVAGKHYTTSFADFPMTGGTISTILVCRMFRNAADATDDTYEHDAGFLAFDIHIEKDTLGSNTDSAK